jgi:hypothetical protein
MPSLSEDLQTAKNTLDEFRSIAERVLNYMPEMINEKIDYLDYSICASTTAGTRKTIRPFNKNLFIKNSDQFNDQYNEFSKTINKLHDNVLSFQKEEFDTVDKNYLHHTTIHWHWSGLTGRTQQRKKTCRQQI